MPCLSCLARSYQDRPASHDDDKGAPPPGAHGGTYGLDGLEPSPSTAPGNWRNRTSCNALVCPWPMPLPRPALNHSHPHVNGMSAMSTPSSRQAICSSMLTLVPPIVGWLLADYRSILLRGQRQHSLTGDNVHCRTVGMSIRMMSESQS